MVFVWGWGGGGPRRRRGWGGRQGYGYGPPPGYGGYRRGYGGGGGGGGCLRDLFLLNTGCCLAESLGCGMDLVLMGPTSWRRIRGTGGGPLADRLIAAVQLYQREISPRRRPCCHFTPSCSAYAVEALERHGALRGSWLTVRRLVRCRPGGARGADPVPT
jgi:putative membrane protein insertion efficiency factor